jgi:hypothetical protein
MLNIPQVPAKLTTICNGELEDRFQDALRTVISSLKPGEKGSITMTLNFCRQAESESIIDTKFKVTKKLPPASKASFIRDLGAKGLQTDAPMEQQNLSFLDTEPKTKALDPDLENKERTKEA